MKFEGGRLGFENKSLLRRVDSPKTSSSETSSSLMAETFEYVRLFWRDNLRSTRRRSASCPNLEHLSQESETQGNNSQNNNAFISTSESESDDDATKKFIERLKVQQSIRRVHKKEKEKKENAEKNLISMDDYLGKLSDLKTWLKEEQKKDVDSIKSPKLKAHFKTFVKLWNKRKLPLKYYKCCSIDLDSGDSPTSPSYSQQPINYQCSPFEDAAKFPTSILHTPFNPPCNESLNNVGSPFSTFGKCDGLLSSPTVLVEQDTNAAKFGRNRENNRRSPHKQNKCNFDQSSQSGSPPKFATISRAIPASSLYKFTAQPWSSGVNVKSRPVLAPKCPDAHNHFTSSSPAVSRTFSDNITAGEQRYKTDAVHQTSSLTKSSGPSPVYSTTIDAIPYNTGSPKYAEIDESICSTPQKLPSSDYCSISPLQKWKPVHADVKQSVSKKQSLSRRRSKSMEDIYSLPFRAGNLLTVADFTDEEYTEAMEIPPIPDRKYSPVAQSSTCPDYTDNKTPVDENCDDYSSCYTTSSRMTLSPMDSPPEDNLHKRRSQESVESADFTASSLKKTKASVSSNLDTFADLNKNSVLNGHVLQYETSPVLSILTGSLNPTTRSKYKTDGSVKSSQANIAVNSESPEPRLSMIKIQQLNESPKLARRRLKRRSSSFSTTPGKGLTFGKTSKMSAASPRRVSFAKNVKEAENKATPGKSSPARYTAAPTFTRQTQDRKVFESFLSSHVNPPKTKASSPDKCSPPKISSPVKQSSPQKYLDNNITPMSQAHHEKQNNMIKKDLFVSKNDGNQNTDSKLSTGTLTDAGKEGTNPLSSRQVGQRALGVPRALPDKIIADLENSRNQNDYSKLSTSSLTDIVDVVTPPLSSTRQVGRRVLGAPRASPDKNIAGGTWVHYPKKAQNTAHFSPQKCSQVVPQVLSPQKHMKVSSSSVSPKKVLPFSPERSLKSSPQIVSSESPKSILPQKTVEYNLSSYGTKVTPQNLSPQKRVSPQEHLRSPQKCNSQLKDGTSQLKYHSITKKLFDLPSVSTSKTSINALVSKLTEKTSTLCARELSESDECLSSDEAFNGPTSELNNTETPDARPGSINMSPDVYSQSVELHTENEAFRITTLESSPGSKTTEAFDCITSCSEASGVVDILYTKEPDPALDHISKTVASCETENSSFVFDSVYKSSLQAFDEISNILPVQELCGLTENEKTDSESNETYHIPELNNRYGYRREKEAVVSQCFKLPAVDMALDYKTILCPKDYHNEAKEILNQTEACLSDLTLADDRKEYEKNYACIQAAETEVSLTSNKVIFPKVDNTEESSLKPASVHFIADDDNIFSTSAAKNEGQCDLKRLASIRASPKVVENDSWITERRRSSRGKSQHSFRSAYNKHLLKSSSKESEEVETDNLSATESLNLTSGFVDSNTGTVESLQTDDNAQRSLAKNSAETFNKDIPFDKHGHSYNGDCVNVVSTGNNSIRSPARVKPPTLPKPSKTSLLAHRNLNAANKSVRNTGKTTPKRLSSVIKSESTMATPTQVGKSRISNVNSKTRLSTKLDTPSEKHSGCQGKPSKRMSSGKYKVHTRKSNERDKGLESNKQRSSEEDSCVQDVESVVSSDQGCSRSPANSTRKVSSKGTAGRRRSKNRSIGEQNKVPSFAEKMKFFNQLRINDVKTQTNRAFGTGCQVKYSPQKQNQTVESPVRTANKNSKLVPLHTTQLSFLAGQEKHSTEIL